MEKEPMQKIHEFIDQQVKNITSLVVNQFDQNLEKQSQAPSQRKKQIHHSEGAIEEIIIKSERKGMKYRTYSDIFKKKAVFDVVAQMHESQDTIAKIIRRQSKKLGIHPKNLQRWYKAINIDQKDGRRKPAFPKMQQELMKLIKNNPNLKRRQIIAHAMKILKEMAPENYEKFNFSKGWYQRFRDRFARKKKLDLEKLKREQQFEIKNEKEGIKNFQSQEKLKIENEQVKIEVYPASYRQKLQEKVAKDINVANDSNQLPLSTISMQKNKELQK